MESGVSPRSLLFSFQGRASRSQFWIVGAPLFLLHVFLVVPMTLAAGGADGGAGTGLIGLAVLALSILEGWIYLALQVKRWHDRGKSGWWCLAALIPIVGFIFLIELAFAKGTDGHNEYGEDPTRSGAWGRSDEGQSRAWAGDDARDQPKAAPRRAPTPRAPVESHEEDARPARVAPELRELQSLLSSASLADWPDIEQQLGLLVDGGDLHQTAVDMIVVGLLSHTGSIHTLTRDEYSSDGCALSVDDSIAACLVALSERGLEPVSKAFERNRPATCDGLATWAGGIDYVHRTRGDGPDASLSQAARRVSASLGESPELRLALLTWIRQLDGAEAARFAELRSDRFRQLSDAWGRYYEAAMDEDSDPNDDPAYRRYLRGDD